MSNQKQYAGPGGLSTDRNHQAIQAANGVEYEDANGNKSPMTITTTPVKITPKPNHVMFAITKTDVDLYVGEPAELDGTLGEKSSELPVGGTDVQPCGDGADIYIRAKTTSGTLKFRFEKV